MHDGRGVLGEWLFAGPSWLSWSRLCCSIPLTFKQFRFHRDARFVEEESAPCTHSTTSSTPNGRGGVGSLQHLHHQLYPDRKRRRQLTVPPPPPAPLRQEERRWRM
ncbi:unnamed protein product [Arctogadus glacialis]